jgi:excisionase family DNA binding protein
MRCDVCGHSWSPEQWRRTGQLIDRDAAVRPVWVSAEQAAETLDIDARTVRRWIKSGRIASETRSRDGRRTALVRQTDVLAIRDKRAETRGA